MVAEMVREQVLRLTRDELPFSTAVLIDKFQEPTAEDHMTRIWATILVERESQKPIVIGRGGEMIKEIGTAARHEIETFLQNRVFLDLRVAVREQWREDERMLDELGMKHPGQIAGTGIRDCGSSRFASSWRSSPLSWPSGRVRANRRGPDRCAHFI